MKWTLLFIRTLLIAVLLSSASGSAVGQGTQIQGPRDAADVYSGVVYGPIDKSDTLWAISSQYRKNQQFTVYQVMLAIYELNPRAFANRNFNTMVNGSMLQLPTDRYIARIAPQRARAKAEQDDLSLTQSTGQSGSSNSQDNVTQAEVENLKPDVPLVNKEELDATQKQFQQQINTLKRQQSVIVNELKQQLSQSIQTTQVILDDNKLVLEQLAKKDQEFVELKAEMSEDFQVKLDVQSAQIEELRNLVRQFQMQEQQEQENSIGAIIREPFFIIIATTLTGFLIFVLIAMMLLRRPTKQVQADDNAVVEDTENIILDDVVSSDSDDLLIMLESDDVTDDDLLDDILSDELEESIDEVSLDTDSFGEIDDEMLVPDETGIDDDLGDALSDLDSDDVNLDTDDLESALDGIDLDDDESDNETYSSDLSLDESSDLIEDSELLTMLDEEPLEVDIDSILDGQGADIDQIAADAATQLNEESALEKLAEMDDFLESGPEPTIDVIAASFDKDDTREEDEQSEIDIDDLLEQNILDSDLPNGIMIDSSGEIDDAVIEQIEAEINDKNIEINTLTDNFVEELESNNFAEDDIDVEEVNDSNIETQKSIQPLDDITKGVEDDIADALANPESDTDLDEISTDQTDDPLSDELLNGLGAELQTDDFDSEIEELLSDPINQPEQSSEDFDIDSVLEDSLSELQTGTIDFEQEEDDEFDHSVFDESTANIDEADDIDIDSVLNDSLEDLVNNHIDDEFDLDGEDNDLTDSSIIKEAEASEKSLQSKELDDIVFDLESADDGETELDGLSSEMLSELDSTEELDEIEIDDIDLGELADLDSPVLGDISANSQLEEDSALKEDDALNPDEVLDGKNKTNEDDELDSNDDLLNLPDLDDWLDDDDDDEAREPDKSIENESKKLASTDSEDDVLREIEEADFDSLLEEMGALSDEKTSAEIDKLALDDVSHPSNLDDLHNGSLENSDLDLTALFEESTEVTEDSKGFIDVDSLLKESENLTPATDEELLLDLDMSLDSFLNVDTAIDVDLGTDQVSNLDLARVYIDMEDNEAALEALEEVIQKGSDEHKKEAQMLIEQLKG
jgi:pilus assembly protein FimV